jgi:hypothetical protein
VRPWLGELQATTAATIRMTPSRIGGVRTVGRRIATPAFVAVVCAVALSGVVLVGVLQVGATTTPEAGLSRRISAGLPEREHRHTWSQSRELCGG